MTSLLLLACGKDDSLNSADRNTVSDDGSIPFEELILLLNIKTSDSSYLVVQSIDSVNIYINDFYWTKKNSEPVDTTKIDKQTIGNQYISGKKINYLIVADQDIVEPDFITAGEFAQYLNAAYRLDPGEYACLIESFQLRFNDSTSKTYYPYEYTTFKVEQNLRSAYVGEITLKID
tara:strand:+ start:426 stop:953 length:528 start_codon:yes stop_codon:yes gene_type:complete